VTSLRVAQIIPTTEAEGPGKRFALWVQGCSIRCPGCCNPEMFAPDKGGSFLEPRVLAEQILATPELEGISVLGGEPFEQAEGLAELCALVKAGGLPVMVYTGYTSAELREKKSAEVDALISTADLLLDGRFDQTKPEKTRRWIGSTNQVLHFLSDRYRADEARFTTPNTVEFRFVNGQLTINGWPKAADAFRRK